MPHYLCKLLAPRPTFPADMTPTEGAAMQAHMAYWAEHMARGAVLAFGPVADPAGAWGLGLLQVEDEAELKGFLDNDPVIQANLGFRTEYLPMPRLVVPGGAS